MDAKDPTCTDATPAKSSVSKFAENLALKTADAGVCTKEARAFSCAVKRYQRRVTASDVRNNPKMKTDELEFEPYDDRVVVNDAVVVNDSERNGACP